LSMWEFNSSAVPLGSIWFGDGTGTRWHIALCPQKLELRSLCLASTNLAWAGELQRTRPWWPRATSTLVAARGSFGPDHGASRRGGARSPPWRDWLRAARYRQAGRQPHERERRQPWQGCGIGEGVAARQGHGAIDGGAAGVGLLCRQRRAPGQGCCTDKAGTGRWGCCAGKLPWMWPRLQKEIWPRLVCEIF
jgi:hypothetical protein